MTKKIKKSNKLPFGITDFEASQNPSNFLSFASQYYCASEVLVKSYRKGVEEFNKSVGKRIDGEVAASYGAINVTMPILLLMGMYIELVWKSFLLKDGVIKPKAGKKVDWHGHRITELIKYNGLDLNEQEVKLIKILENVLYDDKYPVRKNTPNELKTLHELMESGHTNRIINWYWGTFQGIHKKLNNIEIEKGLMKRSK